MAGQSHLGVYIEQGAQKLVIQSDPDGKAALLDLGNDVVACAGDGAPTDGTSGTHAGTAGPGSLYVDYTNAKLYINTNTKASPSWTVVGTQTT